MKNFRKFLKAFCMALLTLVVSVILAAISSWALSQLPVYWAAIGVTITLVVILTYVYWLDQP